MRGSREQVIQQMRSNVNSANRPAKRAYFKYYAEVGKELGQIIGQLRKHEADPSVTPPDAGDIIDALDTIPPVHRPALWEKVSRFEYVSDNLFRCDNCGDIRHRDELMTSEFRCRTVEFGNCCEGGFCWSTLEDTYIPADEARAYYHSRREMDRGNPLGYASHNYLSNSGEYRYSDHFEEWVTVDLWYEYDGDGPYDDESMDDEDDESSPIGGYHSSSGRLRDFIIGPAYLGEKHLPLGMELEVESKGGSRAGNARMVLDTIGVYVPTGHLYCLCENDGSLNNGFEIVTAPCSLDVHEHQMRMLTSHQTLRANLRSHDTSTCGLHVHINKLDTTAWHRGKLVSFINDPANRDLVVAIARRMSDSGYAKFTSKSVKEHNSTDRYEAVNLTNTQTIEFRIFRGSLRFETIMACLEFTRIVWLFCQDAGAHHLNKDEFLRYICLPENSSSTKYLRGQYQAKHILSGRPALREYTICAADEVA